MEIYQYIHAEPFRSMFQHLSEVFDSLVNFGKSFFTVPLSEFIGVTDLPGWVSDTFLGMPLFSICLGAGLGLWLVIRLINWMLPT